MKTNKNFITKPIISLVIPVYNGARGIRDCVNAWKNVLSELDCEIIVIDDGSKDQTGPILDVLAQDRDYNRLRVIHQANAGHGPSIRKGYEMACGEWVFQADSDNEIEPKYFFQLWNRRDQADLVLAERENRSAGLIRQVITAGEAMLTYLLGRTSLKDPNVPFRLIRRDRLMEFCSMIKRDEFAPNILMTLWALKKKWRIIRVRLPQNPGHQPPGTLAGRRLIAGCLSAFGGVVRLLSRSLREKR